MDMSDNPLERWHQIVMAQDIAALDDFLADEVVFHSPILHTPQRGKQLVTRYLSAALRVFFNPSVRVLRKIVVSSDGMFEFETQIDGITVNVVDIMSWDDAGRIVEFKVLVRPLKAIQLTQQRMAAMLGSDLHRPVK
jgi:ketosteroid isomerase-like protein